MSDPNLDQLGGGGSSGSSTGKISPVNIPPAVAEEDITGSLEDEDDEPLPVLKPLGSRIVNDDDDDDDDAVHGPGNTLDVEFLKRVLLGKDISPPKNRRTYSCEQSGGHLWANSPSRAVRMNPRKRTSAPQFGRTNTIKNTIVLRSRRSWPVAPPRIRSKADDVEKFATIPNAVSKVIFLNVRKSFTLHCIHFKCPNKSFPLYWTWLIQLESFSPYICYLFIIQPLRYCCHNCKCSPRCDKRSNCHKQL